MEAQAAQFQVQLAHSFHDARDWVSTTLPGPVGGAVNNALYLVRRLVLPNGEDVGLFGTAECVAARDCSGKDLTGVQLHDQDLSGVDWTGAVLTHANFRNADFSPADGLSPSPPDWPGAWPTANANAVNEQPTDFIRGDLPVVPDLSGVNFCGADLRGANLSYLDLTYANFDQANLTGANLTAANLHSAVLVKADLTAANLYRAVLVNADLTGADLTNATCPNGQDYDSGGNC